MSYVIKLNDKEKYFQWADDYYLYRLVDTPESADQMSLPLAHVALTRMTKNGEKATIIPYEEAKACDRTKCNRFGRCL